MATARLSIQNLNKSYSAPVLTDVSLTVERGEIHAIVGENGAGKTTLGGILAGFTTRDSGRIMLDGVDYRPANPKQAYFAGISCATQELSLIDTLSVAENIAIRNLPRSYSLITKRELLRRAESLLRTVGLAGLDADAQLATLGLAERQLVELAKSLAMDCKALILDEPTAALTSEQAAHVHEIIAQLAQSGVSVIYISHRLKDVLEVSDTVTILRDGRVVTSAPADTLSVARLVQYMSGNLRPDHEHRLPVTGRTAIPALDVHQITTKELPDEISLRCDTGEIIGIAGLSGSGRSELLNALFGLSPLTGGHISRYAATEAINIDNPGTAKRAGMAYLGEDRQSMGLYSGHSVLMNMMTPGRSRRFALLKEKTEANAGAELVKTLGIKCNGLDQDIDQLSGGNQQKILIARWLHCKADIFLLDEPTRGIDVGARNMIYHLLSSLRNARKTILIASSEIEELMALSDRILVMSNRKLVREFAAGDWSEAGILAACFSEYLAQTNAITHQVSI